MLRGEPAAVEQPANQGEVEMARPPRRAAMLELEAAERSSIPGEV